MTRRLRAKNSLGWAAETDGTTIGKASNRYGIMLKRAPGHKRGYYVYTAFPSP
ncbi:hypothetical protein [Streptomyces shenzhenensis]|uniref:hypothetical protein n=1 Tax=Streptomyces shenzhenensis TaxID=943815 RepID=UPI00215DB588|nr:hypothetical protein [Streptomyces shenzhenensis]